MAFEYVIAKKTHLTDQHLQLFIKPVDKPLIYESGQYVEIQYPDLSFQPFSIANMPNSQHLIELHIKLSLSDRATQEFVQSIQINNHIKVRGPFGESSFQCPCNNVILVAAGTGFAPAKAIIEQLSSIGFDKECYLYWSVKKVTDFYLADLITTWQTQLPKFHFIPIITQETSEAKVSLIDKLTTDLDSFADTQIYVFGPLRLATDVITKLRDKNLTADNFFCDMLDRQTVQRFFN